MVRTLLIALLVFGMTACKDEKKEETEKPTYFDLSSRESAAMTIDGVLADDKKKIFKKCVSKRLLEKHSLDKNYIHESVSKSDKMITDLT